MNSITKLHDRSKSEYKYWIKEGRKKKIKTKNEGRDETNQKLVAQHTPYTVQCKEHDINYLYDERVCFVFWLLQVLFPPLVTVLIHLHRSRSVCVVWWLWLWKHVFFIMKIQFAVRTSSLHLLMKISHRKLNVRTCFRNDTHTHTHTDPIKTKPSSYTKENFEWTLFGIGQIIRCHFECVVIEAQNSPLQLFLFFYEFWRLEWEKICEEIFVSDSTIAI